MGLFVVIVVIVSKLRLTSFFGNVSIAFAVFILDLSRNSISFLLLLLRKFINIILGGVLVLGIRADLSLELVMWPIIVADLFKII